MIVVNSRFLTQPITGVQRFAIEISKQLRMFCKDVLFVCPNNIIHTEVATYLKAKSIGHHKGHVWEQVDLPKWLHKQGSPLLINLTNTAPIMYSNKSVVIHDITFIRYPQTYSFLFRMFYKIVIPLIIRSSKQIFSVSNFSAREIAEYYKIESSIKVIYNAVNNRFRHIEDKKLILKQYVLTVSSVKENKNFIMALKVFEKIQYIYPKMEMFIIGDVQNNNFGTIDFSQYVQKEQIHFLGRISDRELIRYYSNAKAFIFPSFYEGFGIPVLEAQACGCPVISSNAASLPEILEDSALLVDPNNINAFVEGIKMLMQKDVSERLIEKGYKNVRRFDWGRSANFLIKTLDNTNLK